MFYHKFNLHAPVKKTLPFHLRPDDLVGLQEDLDSFNGSAVHRILDASIHYLT